MYKTVLVKMQIFTEEFQFIYEEGIILNGKLTCHPHF